MEEAQTRNLYADLGLANDKATQGEIDLAYQNLCNQLASEDNSEPGSSDAPDISRVDPALLLAALAPMSSLSISLVWRMAICIRSAYDILRDPEKRAEYDRSRTGVQNETTSTHKPKYKPVRIKKLEKMLRVVGTQLESKDWRRARARRLPPRARLLVKAHLRAHADRLDRFRQVSRKQGTAEAIQQVGLGPVHELSGYWAQFYPWSEVGKRARGNNKRAQREAKSREDVALEKAAAAKSRDEDIEWIKQEAFRSVRVLAEMAEHPVPEAVGHHQGEFEAYVGRLVETADDLLEYLWDKVHSGTWVCPELKEALDLDQLLGPVLKFEAPHSYFPPSTQNLAASLLRKWHGEDGDETDDIPDSSGPESDEQPFPDSTSSTEGGDAQTQSPVPDSQLYPQVTEQQQSPSALDKQHYGFGARVSVAGSKRMRSPEEQGHRWSKKQKTVGDT